jgi:hypothetical protein
MPDESHHVKKWDGETVDDQWCSPKDSMEQCDFPSTNPTTLAESSGRKNLTADLEPQGNVETTDQAIEKQMLLDQGKGVHWNIHWIARCHHLNLEWLH